MRLNEWECIERVTALAAFSEEHGELGAKLVEHCGGALDEAKTASRSATPEHIKLWLPSRRN